MDTSLLGVKYTSPWQVYCLVLVWAFIAAALMRLQTQTPLGSMANATRDNFERAQFVGYDPRMVRLYQFALSGFFAGIGGGLYVLIYEIVTFDTVSAAKSANALLAVYIGGAGGFFGPILGTIVVVLLQSGVSLLSNAWLLYVGVLFIVMVMYAPGGMIGLIFMHMPIWRAGRLRELALPYARAFPPALLVLLGFVLLVELASFTTIGAAQGKKFSIGGHLIDTTAPLPWVVALAALVLGGLWLRHEARGFRQRWDELMEGAKIQSGAKIPASRCRRRCRERGCRKRARGRAARRVQEIRRHRNHPRRQSLDSARRAPCHHRPQRRRQDHAVQPDIGTISDQLGIDHGQRPIDRQSCAAGDQPARPVAQLPDHLDLPAHDRCSRTSAAACCGRTGTAIRSGTCLGRQKALNQAAEQLLERLKLSDRRNLQAGLLSYAEQRALEIGITIAGGAEIILLDEPTAGMSHSETDSAVALIRAVSEGKTLIMVEHDMSVVFGLADRITVLVYGEVIASDAPAAIRGNAAVQEAYLGTVAA